MARKRSCFSSVKSSVNIYTYRLHFISIHVQRRKEVFLLILNSDDFSLYLYPGIIVTFYFEHVYLENMLNRPFLFHLNYVYLSSLVSVHLASCSAV